MREGLLLNLRCVCFEIFSNLEGDGMFVSTKLHISPLQPWFPKAPITTQRHSSDMAVILIKGGDHFDWAHLAADFCSSGGPDSHCFVAGQRRN
jgi:hypothetical protein